MNAKMKTVNLKKIIIPAVIVKPSAAGDCFKKAVEYQSKKSCHGCQHKSPAQISKVEQSEQQIYYRRHHHAEGADV